MLTFDGSGLKRGATFSEIGLLRGMASLKGDNLLVFYYISASEICLDKRVDRWWEWPYKSVDLWWEWPYKRVTFSGSGLIKIVGHWWKWPYKKGGLRIRGLTFGGSGLRRGLAFGGSGLRRGLAFGGSGLKRGLTFGGRGLRRGMTFGAIGLIRGGTTVLTKT